VGTRRLTQDVAIGLITIKVGCVANHKL